MQLVYVINNLFKFYYLLIIIRIFLTWIPSIDWYSQPFRAIAEITDVYLGLFRRVIPPVGGLDLSPIVAIFALEVIRVFITRVLLMVAV